MKSHSTEEKHSDHLSSSSSNETISLVNSSHSDDIDEFLNKVQNRGGQLNSTGGEDLSHRLKKMMTNYYSTNKRDEVSSILESGAGSKSKTGSVDTPPIPVDTPTAPRNLPLTDTMRSDLLSHAHDTRQVKQDKVKIVKRQSSRGASESSSTTTRPQSASLSLEHLRRLHVDNLRLQSVYERDRKHVYTDMSDLSECLVDVNVPVTPSHYHIKKYVVRPIDVEALLLRRITPAFKQPAYSDYTSILNTGH